MTNLSFKRGLHINLPTSTSEVGAIYFTTDEGSLYLGVNANEAPKRVQGVVHYYDSVTDFSAAVKPPYSEDVIYYVASEGALIRWDKNFDNGEGKEKGKFLIINVSADEFNSNVNRIDSEISGAKNRISTVETGLGTIGEEEDAAFVWLRKLQTAVDALEELTGIDGSEGGSSLADQISALVGDLDKVDERLGAVETWKSTADTTIAGHTNDIAGLKSHVTTYEAKVNTLETTVSGHGSRLDLIDGKAGKIAQVNGRIDATNSAVDGAVARIDTAEGDIAGLKAKDSTIDGQITSLGNDYAALEARVATTEEYVTAHEAKYTTLNNTVSDHATRVANIEKDITDTIKPDISKNKDDIGKINTAIGADSTADSIKGRIKALESKNITDDAAFETLTARVKANEDAIGPESKEGTIKYRLAATEKVANDAAAELPGIKNDLSKAATAENLNAAVGRIADLEAADIAFDTRIDGVDANIEGLTALIGTKGQDSNTSVFGAIKAVEGAVAEQSNTISTVSGVANEAKAAAATANKAIGTASEEGSIKYEIAELKKVNATQATTNANVEGRLKTAENSIDTHGKDIQDLKNAASSYATTAALNKAVEDLQKADEDLEQNLKDEVLSKINAANSLVYIDGISTAGEWDVVKVKDTKIGATYVVAESNLALQLDLDNNSDTPLVKCYAGDLLIATAKDSTIGDNGEVNGVLQASNVEWVHVQSGYKSELQSKMNVVADDDAAKIQLTSLNGNGDAGDHGTVSIKTDSANLSIAVENNVVTFSMVWGSF